MCRLAPLTGSCMAAAGSRKKTEEKILALVKKTGYKTNIHGRNLVLKKTFHFGVIMPQIKQDSSYWEILYNGIEHALADLSAFNIKAQYFFFDKYSEPSFKLAASKALKVRSAGCLSRPFYRTHALYSYIRSRRKSPTSM